MTPDGKTFDPETVTDKQLVQYEQAIDRGLTEADAMRLTEHEYNGFQANAIIAAALNPAVGEDVLDALATPKYTAAQMTAIAKIAIRGGDFARFLDPQMDARRMEAAYLVVAHGGSDLPVERLSRSQLLTINNILLPGLHLRYRSHGQHARLKRVCIGRPQQPCRDAGRVPRGTRKRIRQRVHGCLGKRLRPERRIP